MTFRRLDLVHYSFGDRRVEPRHRVDVPVVVGDRSPNDREHPCSEAAVAVKAASAGPCLAKDLAGDILRLFARRQSPRNKAEHRRQMPLVQDRETLGVTAARQLLVGGLRFTRRGCKAAKC